MPMKRRIDKRRCDGPPASAFDMTFQSGYDYFGDLKEWGITDDRKDIESREAIRDAQFHMADDFKASWEPLSHRRKPWALDAFGWPNNIAT